MSKWTDLTSYLELLLYGEFSLTKWARASSIPPYLRALADYRVLRLTHEEILLIEPVDYGAVWVQKLQSQLAPYWSGPTVIVLPQDVHQEVRRRLQLAGVQFIAPGRFAHLPDLALSDRYRALRSRFTIDGERPLSASAQQVFIYMLLHKRQSPIYGSVLAEILGVSNMTASRALRELDSSGLVQLRRAGQRIVAELSGPARDVWGKAQPLLDSPVRTTILLETYPRELDTPLPAGETALGEWTDLGQPAAPICAVGRAEYLSSRPMITKAATAEYAACALQVWSYDPRPLARDHTVDPLSLHLSLREEAEDDERLSKALRDLMGGVVWSTD